MRTFFSAILVFLCVETTAQAPPFMQWQKCIGGTEYDDFNMIRPVSDGGYILAGSTGSGDGDIAGFKGVLDLLVVKLSNTGAIQWQKCYGGTNEDGATDILQEADGGYIVVGTTYSVDGDVNGNHGNKDIWVIRINSTGTLLWQKCYGSSGADGIGGSRICRSSGGGYIIVTQTYGNDGDVTGYHPPANPVVDHGDIWVLKIDMSGGLVWQRCFGGSRTEGSGALVPTSDGAYIIAGYSRSFDGDMPCGDNSLGYCWMAKLNDAGVILWSQCLLSVNAGFADGKQTSDGGFIFSGGASGRFGLADFHIYKTDANGMFQWEKRYGGTRYDAASSVVLTSDGGYAVAGQTESDNEILCDNKGYYDVWVIKLDNAGDLVWQKTWGGSKPEVIMAIIETTDLGFVIAGVTLSNDGDISGNHGEQDAWVAKLSFPGIEFIPTISITADETQICPGRTVTFAATCTNQGTLPSYQWLLNGTGVGTNNDTLIISSLNDGDNISCILTSNERCITTNNVVSNTISIRTDPTQSPVNFLPVHTVSICQYDLLEMKPLANFKSYLWSTGATTPAINITQPGKYIVNVTTNEGCTGVDSIIVSKKDCFIGFYMSTAFSPNDDGKNDILKPFIGGRIVQYRFIVMNRSGQVVFQTTDPGKGWDGKINGIRQNSDVYVWTCSYQFAGEQATLKKGTVVLIR